jgi:hypoxanthine phosphoribosyltransferase
MGNNTMETVNVLIPNSEIQKRVKQLALDIKNHFGENVYCVVILTGAIVFFVDLMRALNALGVGVMFNLIKVSSYRQTKSTGKINLELGVEEEKIKGQRILIVEDIIDTGITLDYLIKYFQDKKAGEIKICTLLDKKAKRKKDIKIDYVGFEVPDKFVCGYGIDYDQKYRDLNYIGVLN